MKRVIALALCLVLALAACGESSEPSVEGSAVLNIQDFRVVCLYGSYTEAWLLAGGSLVGVTEDAVKERGLDVGDAEVIGTVKEPNAEAIIALEPDLVIFSEDIAAQVDMVDVLTNAGIAVSGYRVDTFSDYSGMMREFCEMNGHSELLEEYVDKPAEQIESAKEQYGFKDDGPRVLLIRAFSSGIKAKTDDELAGAIMKDLGCHNIADDHPSMLEDLSLEEVISADPDYIFVTTMGDEDAALSYLDGMIEANPAWEGLAAIKSGRFHVLPKDLFHYKPNHRWGESYEYLGKLLAE
jgi:iron complex transport system substrate-binding protein